MNKLHESTRYSLLSSFMRNVYLWVYPITYIFNCSMFYLFWDNLWCIYALLSSLLTNRND